MRCWWKRHTVVWRTEAKGGHCTSSHPQPYSSPPGRGNQCSGCREWTHGKLLSIEQTHSANETFAVNAVLTTFRGMYCVNWLQVQQALNNIMQDHTVLVIAHRLSTVEKADNIIVIDGGHVVEQGTHSHLMATSRLYSKMVQRQVLGMETGAGVLNSPGNSWKGGGGRTRRRQSSSSSTSSGAECTPRYWKGKYCG